MFYSGSGKDHEDEYNKDTLRPCILISGQHAAVKHAREELIKELVTNAKDITVELSERSLNPSDYTALKHFYKTELDKYDIKYNKTIELTGKPRQVYNAKSFLNKLVEELFQCPKHCLDERFPDEVVQALCRLEGVYCVVDRFHDKTTVYGKTESALEKSKDILKQHGLWDKFRQRQNKSGFPQNMPLTSKESKPELQRTLSRTKQEIDGAKYKLDSLLVYVYKDDICNLSVDCIVNAANEDLKHGGGLALSISKAAGEELTKDSIRIVDTKGWCFEIICQILICKIIAIGGALVVRALGL